MVWVTIYAILTALGFCKYKQLVKLVFFSVIIIFSCLLASVKGEYCLNKATIICHGLGALYNVYGCNDLKICLLDIDCGRTAISSQVIKSVFHNERILIDSPVW